MMSVLTELIAISAAWSYAYAKKFPFRWVDTFSKIYYSLICGTSQNCVIFLGCLIFFRRVWIGFRKVPSKWPSLYRGGGVCVSSMIFEALLAEVFLWVQPCQTGMQGEDRWNGGPLLLG
jgi:hypothetical protein